MFKRVLVANRGEIASRIIRTLKVLGIETVAVHSDADRGAPFVREADLAVAIGPAEASASYLDAQKIIAAANATGAEAIHPGYGFLSENAGFAEACAKAGKKFIGPSATSIEQLGNKKRAREVAQVVGVPVVPGGEAGADNRAARELAKKIGFPILVKSAGGGGGKGMRRVQSLDGLDDALAAARRESRSAFGTDALLLERLVEGARHVEVQVLGDSVGEVIAVHERDCSLQRRHQKVVEECPSPRVDAVVRKKLLDDAAKLAGSVHYENAGTLEFLLTKENDYFFLEMNTRLQVEHAVTELVCGIDLVAWQVAIAAGARFSSRRPSFEARGHAIEARVYAEDPKTGFLPQTGKLALVRWPHGPGIRVDAGVATGSVVGPHYDPMLAKVVAWGTDREEARARLVQALRETLLVGVTTNVPFLIATLGAPRFRSGDYDTASIEGGVFELDPAGQVVPDDVVVLAAHALAERKKSAAALAPTGDAAKSRVPGPWEASDAFRIVGGDSRDG